jgi:hypothetical protein
MYRGLIKFSSTQDWNWDVEPVQLICNKNTLTKAGAENAGLRTEKTANQTDVLVIALGAYEGTGANRNGDIFKEAECISNYKTFLHSGKKTKTGEYDGRALNRHHKNKPEDPKYGNIKAAAYNKNMRRIELVIGMDNDKCAEEIQKLSEGKQINVSMAAKVAYDKCTWCSHEAKDDRSRCEHIPAKLGEINKRGEMCSMDNINPRWFELSIVGRPADRIGMSLKKVASDEHYVKSAEEHFNLYPGFVIPDDEDNQLISKHASEKRSLAHKLAEIEKRVDAIIKGAPKNSRDKFIREQATKLKDSEAISDDVIDELRKFEPSKLLKALADKGIIFSPEDFMKYLFGAKNIKNTGELFSKVKTRLPFSFSDLDDEVLHNEKFEPSISDIMPKEIKKLVSGLFDNHSLFGEPAHRRILRITIVGKPQNSLLSEKENNKGVAKEASVCELAKQYTAYKLAALRYLDEQNKLDDELLLNSILQNY